MKLQIQGRNIFATGVKWREDGQGVLPVQGLAHERYPHHGRDRNRTRR